MQPKTVSSKTFNFETKPHVLVIEARYHEEISDFLFAGTQSVLDGAGATYERLTVPGALEIPAAIAYAVKALDYDPVRRRFDGYIVLGCVIRGETRHDELVGTESMKGVQELALRHALAIGNAILTVNNYEQALVRARVDDHNRGGHAAEACLRMIELKHHFRLTAKRRWVAKS